MNRESRLPAPVFAQVGQVSPSASITRRIALAAPVTLPLLPVSAFATPADPAVPAYRAWRAAYDAYERSFDRPHVPDDDPIMNAAGGFGASCTEKRSQPHVYLPL